MFNHTYINGQLIISRKPVSVRYPCSKCGYPRQEKVNDAGTKVDILPCQMSSCSTPENS